MPPPPSKGPKRPSREQPRSPLEAKPRRLSGWAIAAGVTAVLWVIFLVIVWVKLPHQLPALQQRGLGLVAAAMAMAAFLMAAWAFEEEDTPYTPIHAGQSQDFARLVRPERKKIRSVNVPLFGDTRLSTVGGWGVFLLVGLWWLTPLAPVRVKVLDLEDFSTVLSDDLTAVVLVQCDGNLAAVQMPRVPGVLVTAARQVSDKAPPYARAMKALAEQKYDDARTLLAELAKSSGTTELPKWKVLEAQGQNEVYAGQYVAAEGFYQEAVKAQKDEPSLLGQAAVACALAGDLAAAQKMAANSLSVCEKKFKQGDQQLLVAMHVQAAIHTLRAEDLDKAGEYNGQAQNAWEKDQAKYQAILAASQSNQGVLFELQARYPEAENNNRLAASSSWFEKLGETHPFVLANRGNLALLDINNAQYRPALEIYQKLASALEPIAPEKRPPAWLLTVGTAMAEFNMDDLQAAMEHASKVRTEMEKSLPANSPALAAPLNTISAIEVANSYYGRGELAGLRAVSIVQKSLGPKHPYLADCLTNLASLYLLQHRQDDAEARLNEAAAIADKSMGRLHPCTARIAWLRGKLQAQREDQSDARRSFQDSLSALAKIYPNGHPVTALVEADMASLDPTARNGVERCQKAIAMAEGFLGKEHHLVADILYIQAKLSLDDGKMEPADSQLSRCMEIRKKIYPSHHPLLADTWELRAKYLRARGGEGAEEQAAIADKKADEIRENHRMADQASQKQE